MKQKLKKFTIIFCAIFFGIFSTLTYPYHEVKAAPAVVVAGGGAAVGTYIVGALTVAGALHAIGTITNDQSYIESSQAVRDHSSHIWGQSTQLAKDAANSLYNTAITSGEYVQGMPTEILNHMTANADKLAQIAMMLNANYAASETPEIFTGETIYTGNNAADPTATTLVKVTGDFLLTSTGLTGTNAVRNGKIQRLASIDINYIRASDQIRLIYNGEWISQYPASAAVWSQLNQGTLKYHEVAQLLQGVGHSATAITQELWETVPGISTYMQDLALPTMDAGLVVPVNDMPFTATGEKVRVHADGAVTTANPTTGEFDVPYSGDIVWSPSIPRPYQRATDAPYEIPYTGGIGLSVPDVVTGAPADIFTGAPTVTAEVPITPTVPPPPYIPPFEDGGSSSLDFTPLMASGDVMSRKFPFSIPFDFVRQLQVFNVEPEAPVFEVRVPEYLQIEHISVPMNFDIDLTMFDKIALIIRWGGVIVFDIGLIFAIRKFLPE